MCRVNIFVRMFAFWYCYQKTYKIRRWYLKFQLKTRTKSNKKGCVLSARTTRSTGIPKTNPSKNSHEMQRCLASGRSIVVHFVAHHVLDYKRYLINAESFTWRKCRSKAIARISRCLQREQKVAWVIAFRVHTSSNVIIFSNYRLIMIRDLILLLAQASRAFVHSYFEVEKKGRL